MIHARVVRNSLVFALVASVCCSLATAQVRGYFPHPTFDREAQAVSLIQLVANAQQYDGKKVRFIGFLRIEFEGDAIYLHREDFENGIFGNAVWVNIPADMTKRQREDVNVRYVICEGVFRAGRHGHMGLFSGEIDGVTRLEYWSGPTEARKRR